MNPIEVQSLARALHETLILAVLREAPMHGYQIAMHIEERSGGAFTFNHGTLYPILHHLEKEGMIDGVWSGGEGRRKRKEYALSAAGRARFSERAGEWRAFWGHLAGLLGEEAVRPRAAAG